MDRAQEYWPDWIGYWQFLSSAAMDRWQRAATRLRKEDYKVESLLSDVAGFWIDTTDATMALWRGSTKTPRTVIFCLEENDETTGSKFVPVFSWSLPNQRPSFVWLKCLDSPEPPPEHRIDWKNLFVRFTDDRTHLELKVYHLRPPLVRATYRAIVHVGEVPVVEVLIVVREGKGKKPAGTDTQGQARREK